MDLDLTRLSEALRAASYDGLRQTLEAAGIAAPSELPELYAVALDAVRACHPDAFDEQVAEAFSGLDGDAGGRAVAWRFLHLRSDAAGVGVVTVGKSQYGREIQRMGRAVAWRDAKVGARGDLGKAGQPKLKVLADAAAVEACIAELGGASFDWGKRTPGVGTPKEERDARLALISANDARGLAAYLERLAEVRVPRVDKEGRIGVHAVYAIDWVLDETVRHGEHVALVVAAMAHAPQPLAVRNAASLALTRGRVDMFEVLLPGVPDVDMDFMGETLLAQAARERRTDAVELLLRRGAKPTPARLCHQVQHTVAPRDGDGALLNAVRNGDAPLVARLLSAGADPMEKTLLGRRVADVATELGNADVIALFADSQSERPPKTMREACATLDVERILLLLPEAGPSDPVLTAAQGGQTELLRAVCDRAALEPRLAAKALFYSAQNGHLANVELLLERGADPNGYTERGMPSARKQAESKKHHAIAARLAAAGGKLTDPKRPG